MKSLLGLYCIISSILSNLRPVSHEDIRIASCCIVWVSQFVLMTRLTFIRKISLPRYFLYVLIYYFLNCFLWWVLHWMVECLLHYRIMYYVLSVALYNSLLQMWRRTKFLCLILILRIMTWLCPVKKCDTIYDMFRRNHL